MGKSLYRVALLLLVLGILAVITQAGSARKRSAYNNDQEAGDDGSAGFIDVKVVGEDGSENVFRVKRSDRMGKLKNAYAERVGVAVTSLRFEYGGRTINDDDTPIELEMENNDEIKVIKLEQDGF